MGRPLTSDRRDEVAGVIEEYIRTLPPPPPPIEIIGHHFKPDGTLVVRDQGSPTVTDGIQVECSASITAPTSPPAAHLLELGCGYAFEAEIDGPAYAVRQCAPHAAKSVEVEREIEKRLGYELDVLVTEACQGRKLERIRPVDHTKR